MGLLRPGNADSNTAADHLEAARLALARLPKKYRRGRQTLIHCDSVGGTHEFVAWLAARGRRLSYSVGMTITDAIHQAVSKIPASTWTSAVEPDGEIRDGAWVAEIDADSNCLTGRQTGIRLIVRKEHPHPGAQLRFTDADEMRLTCFAINTKPNPIAAPELAAPPARPRRGPHPRRPHHRPAQPSPARHRAEPDLAGDRPDRPGPVGLHADARSHRGARLREPRRLPRLAKHWPWTGVITDALDLLKALPNPGWPAAFSPHEQHHPDRKFSTDPFAKS